MKKNNCIIWRGAKGKKGYGVIRINNKLFNAHRLSYILFKGSIPGGMLVCHSCDNPPCINPEHLFLGTAKDNTRDMNKKLRGLYGRQPLLLVNTITGESTKHLSQSDLAKEIGVNQATVSYAKQRSTLVMGIYQIVNIQK